MRGFRAYGLWFKLQGVDLRRLFLPHTRMREVQPIRLVRNTAQTAGGIHDSEERHQPSASILCLWFFFRLFQHVYGLWPLLSIFSFFQLRKRISLSVSVSFYICISISSFMEGEEEYEDEEEENKRMIDFRVQSLGLMVQAFMCRGSPSSSASHDKERSFQVLQGV